MNFDLWRKNIIDAAKRAADRQYQERVWFGGGPEVDSPTELFCAFFDDFLLKDFLAHPLLQHDERLAGCRLYDALEKYADQTPKVLNPGDVLDDPRFEDVRLAASEFLKVANCH